MSSGLALCERFLHDAGFDRAPWLAVGFAAGIAGWFVLANPWQWLALVALGLGIALGALAGMRREGMFPFLRQSLAAMGLVASAGCLTVWAKSELVGTPPIAGPKVATISATLLERQEQPAEGRIRLVLATREPGTGRIIKVRLNLPLERDTAGLAPGAKVRLKARMMPPAPPMLPGGHDFARTAWFAGLAATGSVLGEVWVEQAGQSGGFFARLQASLADHVRARVPGAAGAIVATLASGDRGAIPAADEQAMRDAGLTHLLSISGLHVSAVVAAAYLVAIRLLALWPALALRLRLPIVAAGAGAGAGIFYTLLTGSEVPTIRSCIGAVLVLLALAVGREPLSLRMLAVAALFVMVFWPEAVIGPSFQMSFASVIAIIALHGAEPVRRFLGVHGEPWWARALRHLAMLLLTGFVIEIALMPIGLFHFHRAGVYGAMANVIAIPLTTFVTMPLIAVGLLLDAAGAGAPAWWLAGKSVDLLLGVAHFAANQPGAVTLFPAMSAGTMALFAIGGLWLALWRGKVRLLGLLPVLVGGVAILFLRPPDILVSGDGHHVAITGASEGELLVLHEGRSEYVRDNLMELTGQSGTMRAFEDWPGARCSHDFCALAVQRGGQSRQLLVARGRNLVEEPDLKSACARADIVIAERWLPRSCHPRLLKADRALLSRTGGLAIDLASGSITTVAQSQGEHGWWRTPEPKRRRNKQRRQLPDATSSTQTHGAATQTPAKTAATAQ